MSYRPKFMDPGKISLRMKLLGLFWGRNVQVAVLGWGSSTFRSNENCIIDKDSEYTGKLR